MLFRRYSANRKLSRIELLCIISRRIWLTLGSFEMDAGLRRAPPRMLTYSLVGQNLRRLIRCTGIGDTVDRRASYFGIETPVGVNAHKEIGTIFPGHFHPLLQRHEIVALAGEKCLDLPVFTEKGGTFSPIFSTTSFSKIVSSAGPTAGEFLRRAPVDDPMEKDVVLKIGEKVASLFSEHGEIKAFLTRKGDYFVPLEKR